MFFSKASQRERSLTICTQWIGSKTVLYAFSNKNVLENKIQYKQQPEIAHETVSNSGSKRLQHIRKQTKQCNWAFLQSVGPPHLHRRSACRHLSTGLPSYSLQNGYIAQKWLTSSWESSTWALKTHLLIEHRHSKRKIQWGTLAVLPGALSQSQGLDSKQQDASDM